MRKKISLIKRIRKRLVAAEEKYKSSHPLLAREARIAEEFVNYPSSQERFFKRGQPSFFDKPRQLKGKRVRKFLLPTLGINAEINTPSNY